MLKAKATTLEQALKLPNGPRAKFYMVKFAPHYLKGVLLSQRHLGCDQIRKKIRETLAA